MYGTGMTNIGPLRNSNGNRPRNHLAGNLCSRTNLGIDEAEVKGDMDKSGVSVRLAGYTAFHLDLPALVQTNR
jgi:hypothetical protein